MPITIRKAMVFAAGFGTRMKPLTDTIPKPLITVAGKALLDYSLDQLAAAGVTDAVVNTHYKAEQIHAHIAARLARQLQPAVTVSHETEILETAGGVVQALPLLGDAPFFSLNSDTICIDTPGSIPALKRLEAYWDPAKMDMLFLLQPREKAIGHQGGDFFLSPDGEVYRPDSEETPPYIFTGIQIISPHLFAGMPVEKRSLRTLFFDRVQPDGRLDRIYGVVHDGDWLDIGTPEGIGLAERFLASF